MDMMNVLYAVLVLGIMGGVLGLVLAIASKVFYVEIDPRVDAVMACLPGANCGGCGFAGCTACAKAMVNGECGPDACVAGGSATATKIAGLLGGEATETERKVAFVNCNGGKNANRKFEYVGIMDCDAAMKVAGGPLECANGCLGMGTCVGVCQFGALSINANGTAVVNPEKCTNCGACRKVCPRGLIIEKPYAADTVMRCANQDKGAKAQKLCSVSCIGCRICEKGCEEGAITVVNNVARIDYSKCTSCGKCVAHCPRRALFSISGKVYVVPEAELVD